MNSTDRTHWLTLLQRVSDPVLKATADRRLRAAMPVQGSAERATFAPLEAIGRLLAGLAPWVELEEAADAEGQTRSTYAGLAREAIDAITDPASADYATFDSGGQPLVDAAFLAHAVLRAPRALWQQLDGRVQRNLVAALLRTRHITPGPNNWLLFSATIEATLGQMGERADHMRIDYALRQHEQWYKGDGAYGDGAAFHWDYYNSFVIHPMLLDITRSMAATTDRWQQFAERIQKRAIRYAAVQERMIGPDGSFPPIGRSLVYRCGAFQLLAQVALSHDLPAELPPPQVRCALGAVIDRTLTAPGTFDANGWLQRGLCGAQPSLGESYIGTGSLYLCSTAFLPLGLPGTDGFWACPATDWTARKVWCGQDLPADHALHE
ncbi:MAG TPA: DUF2264 domain-containing protein [Tepidisphaeraceae bacterium]|nr:DUF2264 domain-containing protein [Tepidisphaeraceae bacterium]